MRAMSMRVLLVAVALAGALTACPGSAPPPSGTRPPDPLQTPPTTSDPGAVQDVDPTQPSVPPPEFQRADGEVCFTGDQCASGTCEGRGCGESQPGRCMPRARMCTRDLRTYCGCDGQPFQASGSCPGRRYASTGDCAGGPPPPPPPPPATKKPDGAACLIGDECGSGVCEGQGCGSTNPGRCAPRTRACTKDLRMYCGCDGRTFQASGSCPGRRFAKAGACSGPPGPPPGKKPDGAACLGSDECTSGVCEGEGCGDAQPGKCMPRARGCTRDLRTYCGCDGKTFRASGSCPGRRFASRDKCEGS
jgi:hypothetical protein